MLVKQVRQVIYDEGDDGDRFHLEPSTWDTPLESSYTLDMLKRACWFGTFDKGDEEILWKYVMTGEQKDIRKLIRQQMVDCFVHENDINRLFRLNINATDLSYYGNIMMDLTFRSTSITYKFGWKHVYLIDMEIDDDSARPFSSIPNEWLHESRIGTTPIRLDNDLVINILGLMSRFHKLSDALNDAVDWDSEEHRDYVFHCSGRVDDIVHKRQSDT
jgi:hypothetical protein